MALTYQSNMLVCRMTKDQNTCQSGEKKFRTVYPNLIFATFADLQPV